MQKRVDILCRGCHPSKQMESIYKEKETMVAVEFREALELFRMFLEPIVEAVVMEEGFEAKWDCKSKCWK